jgi:hypothetical protein
VTENYTIESRFAEPLSLRLRAPAFRDRVASVTINGGSVAWRPVEDQVAAPGIEILGLAATRHDVVITWAGLRPSSAIQGRQGDKFVRVEQGQMRWWQPVDQKAKTPAPAAGSATNWKKRLPASTRFDKIRLAPYFNDRVTDISAPANT